MSGEAGKVEPSFPITCAWCAAEGTYRVVSYSVRTGSHGICPEHQKIFLEQIRRQKVRRLLAQTGAKMGGSA